MSFKLKKKDGTFTDPLSYATLDVFDSSESSHENKKFYITEGEKSITTNGKHDVSGFKDVNVSVQSAGVPTLSATYNGESVDVGTSIDSLKQNISVKITFSNDDEITLGNNDYELSGSTDAIVEGDNEISVSFGGMSDTIIVQGNEPTPSSYKLFITQTGVTVTVNRDGINIPSGTNIYAGQELIISGVAEPEYQNPYIEVNGSQFTSGNTYIVSGNVTIVATATKKPSGSSRLEMEMSIAGTGTTSVLCVFPHVQAIGNAYPNHDPRENANIFLEIVNDTKQYLITSVDGTWPEDIDGQTRWPNSVEWFVNDTKQTVTVDFIEPEEWKTQVGFADSEALAEIGYTNITKGTAKRDAMVLTGTWNKGQACRLELEWESDE